MPIPSAPAGLAARQAALAALRAVLEEGAPLDVALDALRARKLPAQDQGFAALLVRTALRRLGQCDALLAACMARPLEKKALAVQHILRLGLVQLLWLGTPAHAAVHTSVELAKEAGFQPLSGMVNAVLKRVAREKEAMLAGQDEARLNTPGWLWDSWAKAYGEPAARAIALAHLREPPLDLTVKENAAPWAERLGGTLLPTGSVRLVNAGSVPLLPGYAEGAWWVQDAAAALPARLLGDVKGKRVIDLCAAPGGKTAQLAAAGARVTAVDISAQRLRLVEENLARLRLDAALVAADALAWRPPQPADAVLLDAPCSATGTLRRHPDVARHRQKTDISRMAALQRRLLESALEMLKPEGLLVYSVCSLQPEEGEAQIAALLATRDDVRLLPARAEEIGLDAVTPLGEMRTLPCLLAEQGGVDGFYAARIIKLDS